jgi:hypothetical protein
MVTRIRQPGKPLGQGDAARAYIAAFNRSTGTPTRFAPKLNGAVWSIATSPDGKWVVIDEGMSRNGSFVNDERVHGVHSLDHEDELRFGGTSMTFRLPAESAAAETFLGE